MFKPTKKYSATSPNPNRQKPVTMKVVKNTRWIHSNELKMGMYVRELEIPWEETNFMFQGFVIDSLELLQDVQAATEYCCVESEKVARISTTGNNRLCGVYGSR